MSEMRTAGPSTLTIRWILPHDLPALLHIEQQPPAPQWTQSEFKALFHSADTAGWVADIAGRVVGFLVYRVTSSHQPAEGIAADFPGWRSGAMAGEMVRNPLTITLLNLAVIPAWRRRGIGRALLQRIGQKLQLPQDSIAAAVPESNLPVQLLLRDAGYRARAVRRNYYGTEDAYVLQRRPGSAGPASAP